LHPAFLQAAYGCVQQRALKIDPPMAAFNAIAWMAAHPASSQPSIFVI
jgi:hypothetical protein